jgi:Putative zinc-finger
MNCSDLSGLLDDYVDGALATPDRALLETHLAGCSTCRQELAALRGLVADAQRLPRAMTPPVTLWPAIASRIAASPPAPSRARPARRLLRAGLRLAAALALILFGAALATLWQRRTAPDDFAAARARYAQASAVLARELADNPGNLAPSTRAVVERNLTIVDQAIREAEAALASDPGNTALEQMLLARYQQRLGLLSRATSVGHQES